MTTTCTPAAPRDLTRLAYSGNIPDAATRARRARRWGWWYMTEYQLRNMRRYGWPVLVYDVGQPLLYLLAMGLGLGAIVDANSGAVDGVPYLVFVAPALAVSTSVMTAASETTYPVMSGFKWQRLYYAPAATAVSPGQIATGHLLAVSLRFIGQATVFWILMSLLGATSGPASLLLIPAAGLAALAFAAPLQAYSATLREEGFQFSFIQRFVVMPMFLFAGTFFELTTMPPYLQWIGWISPVWHGAELARAATYGHALTGLTAAIHLGFLTACVVVGHVWARRNYRRRLGE